MNDSLALQQFISAHLKEVEPLTRETALAVWEHQTTSTEEAKNRVAELSTRLTKIYANAEEFAFLQRLSPDALEGAELARQHTLLLNDYLGNQMDEKVIEEIVTLEIEIEDTFNTYRATVRGEQVADNTIDSILLESTDVALRHEAWDASKRVGATVIDKLMQLVRLRNREAQRLGFDTYYTMRLALQEVDETRLFALLQTLFEESAPRWATYKSELDALLAARFETSPEAIRPWHHANRFFQEPGSGEADLDRFFVDKDLEALTEQFYAAIGLSVDDLLRNADLYERPGKSQHAFCLDVDRKGDIRVLCNNRPTERWMGTMLHEFGHAVYDKFHNPSLPYLLRQPAHTMATEAIALFMGRLTKDASWLRIYADVPEAEAQRISEAARKELQDHLLVFMRWCLVMAHFERELYRDPEQDLEGLWWDLVAKYQNLVCPESERPPHAWAAKIHLASSPVYYHNYQLGEMLASQLLHHLNTVVLKGEGPDALVTSSKVGAYLQDRVFAPGSLRPWEAWLEYATGEMLNPEYFVQQLG